MSDLTGTAPGGVRQRVMPLEEAREDVDGWLDEVKLKTGKCSRLMRHQLAEGMRHRIIAVHNVYDEIGLLEGSGLSRRTGTKPAEPLKGQLRPLMHKHYKVSSLASFAINQRNHWGSRKNRAELTAIVNEFFQDGHSGKFAHGLVFGAHTGRHASEEMTGEWIVYATIEGINYYLTLAAHREPNRDQAIAARVRSCFGEFPELRAHLGWED